jgi:hypothetical protein
MIIYPAKEKISVFSIAKKQWFVILRLGDPSNSCSANFSDSNERTLPCVWL